MNIYNDCPLDARDFTDYRSTSDINNEIINKNNIKNSFEYNKFITNNATKMISEYTNDIEKKYGCGPHADTMLNEKNKQHCDKNKCTIKPFDKNGLGLGRDFYSINCSK